MQFDDTLIDGRIGGALRAIESLRDQMSTIRDIGEALQTRLASGGAVWTCGNGGSAAEAMHMAEELIGRYRRDRDPFPAVCLNADSTALTCIANDFGFEEVFSRQVSALAGERDVLVVYSTSGSSDNLVRALDAAAARKCLRIGLLGKGGGLCASLCDLSLVVDSDDTAHIQEAHQVVMHILLEGLDQ